MPPDVGSAGSPGSSFSAQPADEQARRAVKLWPALLAAYGLGYWVLTAADAPLAMKPAWLFICTLDMVRLARAAASREAAYESAMSTVGLEDFLFALESLMLAIVAWQALPGMAGVGPVMLTAVYVVLVPLEAATHVRGWPWVAVWTAPIGMALAYGWVEAAWPGGLVVSLSLGVGYAALIGLHAHGERTTCRLTSALERERELQAALAAARRESVAAAQAKARFFAAASHDLRQPLHALAVNATPLQIVAARTRDPLIKELSDGINRALAHSDHLLDSLLDISRLDASAVSPRFEPIAVGVVLDSLVRDCEALARQHGIALTAHSDAGAVAWADGEMLTRIVRNLLSNALKFTPHGGRVELEARQIHDEVIVLVRDSGPGIPHEMRDRIFEEFFQLGNPARDRSQGLGLGLSIVRRLATLLGAHVQVDCARGAGTCFSLRLRCAALRFSSRRMAAPPSRMWPSSTR